MDCVIDLSNNPGLFIKCPHYVYYCTVDRVVTEVYIVKTHRRPVCQRCNKTSKLRDYRTGIEQNDRLTFERFSLSSMITAYSLK